MFIVVDEDGQATLPRELLVAANAEPGDLIECWVTGPTELAVKVVFAIPQTGDPCPASHAAPSRTAPEPPAEQTDDANDPDGRPILTIWDMLDRRPRQDRMVEGVDGTAAGGAPSEATGAGQEATGDGVAEGAVGGRAERRRR